MKFLVISDNHGQWPLVNEIIQKFRSSVDFVFHCGDSEFPADDPIWEDVDAVVSGNMDFDPQFRRKQEIETQIGNVLLVHGHLNGVNYGNDELMYEAKKHKFKFVFHGHTHILYADYQDGILIANPGSLSRSRGPYPYKTFMLVNVEPDEIIVEYYDENRNLLPQLCKTFRR